MDFVIPPRTTKIKKTGLVIPQRTKPVLEYTEKEKQRELNKYMSKVIRGLKTKALIKKQSIIPTEPIVIPPRDDKPKGFISGFKEGFKLPFKKFFPTIRAGAQLASTPVAYGIDKIQGGDITYSQLSEENFAMAKEMIRGDTKWGDNMSKGAQLYLKSQAVGKYGKNEIGLKDIGVLASMGFFNIFGDPFLEATAFARLIKGVKEIALWKKVGQIKKQLPIGTIIKKPNIVEIPIAKDLKIKIKPFRSEIKIEGFAKRSWKPEILPPQKLIGTTDEAVKDLVKIVEQQSGAKVTGVIKGKDLILQPTLKSQLLATEAGFAKLPDKPKLKISKEIIHGTDVNIAKIRQEGFKFGTHSVFGKAAFFTDSQQNRLAFGENILKINIKNFNLRLVETVKEQSALIEQYNAKNLTDAIIKEDKYDGFIVPNKDPKVGNTYGITNKIKLDNIIKEVKQPAPLDLKKIWGTGKAKEKFRLMAKEFPEPEQRAGVKDILKGIEEKEIMGTAFKDVEREMNFYDELENQYQNFKQLKLQKLDEIEDASQLKKIKKAEPEKIDNILYHQKKTADEVFDIFKERLLAERLTGYKGEKAVIAKTNEYEVISDEMKNRISLFYRPSRKRQSRAFALLGNKDTTVPLFKEIFNQWVKGGVDTIIEPYAGAYTLGTHSLQDAIKNGLKEFHSNVFDKEKYIIVKAIQDNKINDVKKSINKAVDTLNNSILLHAVKEPTVSSIFNNFLSENPDSYIGSNQWVSYIKKLGEGKEVLVYGDVYNKFRKVFQNAINEVYDIKVENLDTAILNSLIKKIGVFGGKGQSFLRNNGFMSFEAKIFDKYGMINAFEDMDVSFKFAKKNNTTIKLYNQDGVKFIQNIKIEPSKTGIYFDPPYVKSSQVYAKTLPPADVEQLEKFTSGKEFHSTHIKAFDAVNKGAKIALTNDIEQEYLNIISSKIKNSKIFGYKEGNTPTSLIVSEETNKIINGYLTKAEKVTAGDLEEIARIKELQEEKQLSNLTISGIRHAIGIKEIKNATPEKIDELITILEKLKEGDKLLTSLQREGLESLIEYGNFKNSNLIMQREMREKFAEHKDILQGRISKHIATELFPTIDIKEGHPIITRTVDRADNFLREANKNIEARSKRINDFMDKAEQSEKLKKHQINEKIFIAQSGGKVNLTKKQVAVRAYLKNFFNKVAKDFDLKAKNKYRKSYIPHIERQLMERIRQEGILGAVKTYFNPLENEIPVDILLALDNIIGKEKFWKYMLERKGGMKPTMNIRKIVNEYSQIYEIKKALDKILPEAQASQQLLLQNKSKIWMKEFLQNLKGRGLDSKFRNSSMGWMPKTADRIIDMQYILLLGGNYMSAIKNIIGGEMNNFVYQSFFNYIKGKQRLACNPVKAIKFIKNSGILDGSYMEMIESSLLKKGKKITNHLLFGGMEIGEYEIRGSFLLGELTTAEWDAALIEDYNALSPRRFREILNGIARTQGIYTKVDSPLFVQTWYGRAMIQFGRWRLTNAMLLRKISKGVVKEYKAGDYAGINTKRLIKMLISSAIMMYMGYELGKRGYKTGRKIALAGTELIKNVYELLPPKILYDVIATNPTISILSSMAFDIETIGAYIGITDEPYPITVKKHLKDTYIAGLRLFGVYDKKKKPAKKKSLKKIFNKQKNKKKSLKEIFK